MKKVISFPHMGDYYVPIAEFLRRTTKAEVAVSPPITKKTISLGAKYSPEAVCLPFKYNLGNFIESLENGANILFTAGGGCRYRYYAEVSEVILRDLGYEFSYYSIMNKGKVNFKELFKILKEINPSLKVTTFIHSGLYALLCIWDMDKIDKIIRKNIGFEKEKNTHIKLKKKMLNDFKKKKSLIGLTLAYFKYKYLFKKIPLNKPKNPLKVAIIGELFTAMEPFSSYFLEMELAKFNVEIKRYTNLSYLLWQKKFLKKYLLFMSRKWCKYSLGADGLDNVYRTTRLIRKKYDGIIHTKPFGCTPEVGAIPIIQKICQEEEMPIMFLSFDVETSNEGIRTRLEAFYDLLSIRRKKK